MVTAGLKFDEQCEHQLLAYSTCGGDSVDAVRNETDSSSPSEVAGKSTVAEIRPIEPPVDHDGDRAPPRPSPVDGPSYAHDIEQGHEAAPVAEAVDASDGAMGPSGAPVHKRLEQVNAADRQSSHKLSSSTPLPGGDIARTKDADRPIKRRKIQLFEVPSSPAS